MSHAVQDKHVTVESSNKMWSTGEGNYKPLQYSCHKYLMNMNSMIRKKDMTLEGDALRLVSVQYATEEEWRNSSRKNEVYRPNWNYAQLWMFLVVKVLYHKEQYYIGTWNFRSINQDK